MIAEIKKTNNVADYQKSYPDLNVRFKLGFHEILKLQPYKKTAQLSETWRKM